MDNNNGRPSHNTYSTSYYLK